VRIGAPALRDINNIPAKEKLETNKMGKYSLPSASVNSISEDHKYLKKKIACTLDVLRLTFLVTIP
jgi:hypothetical protein